MTRVEPGQRLLGRRRDNAAQLDSREPSAASLRISLRWTFAWRPPSSVSGAGGESQQTPQAPEEGVLLLEIVASADGTAVLDACVEQGGSRRVIHQSLPATVRFEESDNCEQFTVRAADRVCLTALLRPGRAAWIRSALPHAAGLPGGTYETPTLAMVKPEGWRR